jgi:hypothetical protein
MAKKHWTRKHLDEVGNYYEMHARSKAIDAGKPSAERKRGPGPTGHGVYQRPFSPGPIPDITKEPERRAAPAQKKLMSSGRSLSGGGR